MLNRINLLFFCLTISCSSVQAEGMYKLLGKPSLGSKIKPVEATASFPFDKEYRQFTEKQKADYRSQWEGLAPDDIPPFPKRGTKTLYEPIIKGHAKIARGGMLSLVAKISEKGEVEEVAIYESPHEDITQLAMSVMFHAKFRPGKCAGKPCKMEFPFQFELRRRVKDSNTLNSEDIPGKVIQ